ncbi:MAG: polysaccharide pyruvyl transferase family protein, partial [Deltaproteobacteria bacterium]|nr:polysaccharide pyruvyl transferase family protein [Deltaproteobacteria bacterium]
VFLPMDTSDEAFCEEIIEASPKPMAKVSLNSLELQWVVRLFSQMDLVISMRLHGLILASCLAVPVIAISGVTKNTNFLAKLGCEESNIDIQDLSLARFREVFNHLWASRALKKQNIQGTVTAMRKEEEKNFAVLRTFLK